MISSIAIIVISVVTILVSLPLIAMKVPRNDWYGIRTAHTMAGSENDWYATNRKGGLYLCGVGLITLAVCTVVLLVVRSHRTVGLLVTPIFVILLVAAKTMWSAGTRR